MKPEVGGEGEVGGWLVGGIVVGVGWAVVGVRGGEGVGGGLLTALRSTFW